MASKQDTGGMDIRIHPLVVMSITDHYTRSVVQFNKKRVIGALFGVQSGREVHLLDTFEIGFEEKDSQTILALNAFENDMKLLKAAFPEYECLGWYSSGSKPSAQDAAVHQAMTKFNERPLFLLLDPTPRPDPKELPIFLYEEELQVRDKSATTAFVQISFKLQADEAERITAAHCAKVYVAETKGPQSTMHKAVKTLRDRVGVLQNFLKDVAQGKVQADHKILRAIKGLCNRLPAMDSEQFGIDFLAEYNDALLVTYLANVTKGTEALESTVEKFNMAYASQPSHVGPMEILDDGDTEMFSHGKI